MVSRLLLLVSLACAAIAQPPSLFHQVDEMTAALSNITGWSVKRKIPAEILSKEKFHRYVDSHVKGSANREQLRAEEITLKMFGFVPPDFDLAKETVDLVSEQAAAYYDYNKKRLYVLDSTPEGMEQRVALVHELAHALADQHHPLGKYLRKGDPDDDQASARQAVMEGQATWLTWAYVSKHSGGKAEVPAEMLNELTKTLGAESPEFPVFAKSPLYMRESLTFPYNGGLRFQDAIFHKLGRAGFDEVFTHPPASTQQILHPDAYLRNQLPTEPKPPPIEAASSKKQARQFQIFVEGTLGEFDHSVLLRQYVDEKEGADAASHLRGSAYAIYEHRHDKYPVLTYRSEWDSPQSAQRFFELYQRVMRGRWKQMDIDRRESDWITGRGDSGKFELGVKGSAVESIEGLR